MRIPVCLLALLWAPLALGAYKCVDEKGATHFGDAPPEACAKVKTYEIGKSGAVVRTLEPAATAAEQHAGRAEREQKRDTDRAATEAKRRDRALLDSYTSDREIDAARDRNVEMLKGRLAATVLRMKPIEQREKDLERAIESYKARKPGMAGEVPSQLRTDLEKAANEKSSLAATIGRYETDLEQTRRQFEADRKRWIELHGSR